MEDQLRDQGGLRADGRRPLELRQIRVRLGVFRQADGSAYLEQGKTKVLATVYGPHQVVLHFYIHLHRRYQFKLRCDDSIYFIFLLLFSQEVQLREAQPTNRLKGLSIVNTVWQCSAPPEGKEKEGPAEIGNHRIDAHSSGMPWRLFLILNNFRDHRLISLLKYCRSMEATIALQLMQLP